ncbi:hypothetical protein [Marichromatium gracile]|uniref:Uncharacterized protein n=1 Tax=Marichromatium gracile TaxID=1048 RepID=A0ABR5VIA6_MARGR|nr:hypothetical protein [Marichromatium gracile]KXX65488.1 hypothetical protein AY586_01175 [Marichromatium gracile]
MEALFDEVIVPQRGAERRLVGLTGRYGLAPLRLTPDPPDRRARPPAARPPGRRDDRDIDQITALK